jgi:hypothetical protein
MGHMGKENAMVLMALAIIVLASFGAPVCQAFSL